MIFYKSSSGGNDFILLEEHFFSRIKNKTPFIRNICDRHSGVGGDGVIVFKSEGSETTFSIFNRDGTRAELSGNGMSGLASLLFYKGKSISEIVLSTDSGIKRVKLLSTEGNRYNLSVEIGEPDFSNKKFFPFLKKEMLKYQIENIDFYPVSVGNPHAVIFFDAKKNIINFEKIAKKFQDKKIFPQLTNIKFIPVSNKSGFGKITELKPLFFERGVGITRSSSTGSAAIFAVLRELNMIGNSLSIKNDKSTVRVSGQKKIYIENSTEIVYKGTYLKHE